MSENTTPSPSKLQELLTMSLVSTLLAGSASFGTTQFSSKEMERRADIVEKQLATLEIELKHVQRQLDGLGYYSPKRSALVKGGAR